MTKEAKLSRAEHGVRPTDGGWFVVGVGQAAWKDNPRFGTWCGFEGSGDGSFPQVGVNVTVLNPGQAGSLYHREDQQENFLVLDGLWL